MNRTGVERESVGHLHIAASGLGDQHVAWQVIIVVRFASINEITTLAVIILDPSVIAAVLVGSQLNRIAHGHLKRSWRNENDVSHFHVDDRRHHLRDEFLHTDRNLGISFYLVGRRIPPGIRRGRKRQSSETPRTGPVVRLPAWQLPCQCRYAACHQPKVMVIRYRLRHEFSCPHSALFTAQNDRRITPAPGMEL